MVEDALTKIPAVVLVGVKAKPPKVLCHAPFCPSAPPAPQAEPVPEMRPLVSICIHCVEPVIVLIVSAPATVTAPLNLEVPITPSVVLGAAVPIPTRFSLMLTTNTFVSATMSVANVEVAVSIVNRVVRELSAVPVDPAEAV